MSECRKAVEQDAEADASFEPRERRAEAVVDANSEAEMPRRIAREIQHVRVRELLGIAVGCGQEEVQKIAATDHLPADLYVFQRNPIHEVEGRIVAK